MKKKKAAMSAVAIAMSLALMIPVTSFAASDDTGSSYTEDEADYDDEYDSDDTPYYGSYTPHNPVPYPKSIDFSKLTGDTRSDAIAIAKSQVGYKEVHDDYGQKYTYYARVCGSNPSRWCSEFSAWTLYMAGMPRSVLSCTNVYAYRYYFGEMGCLYDLAGGHPMGKSWIGSYDQGTLQLSDIQPGDIILMRTPNQSSKTAPEPHHTCFVYSVDTTNKKIKTYDGNSGSGEYKKVANSTYAASTVYAVIKVPYNIADGGRKTGSECNHRYFPTVINAGDCKTKNQVRYTCRFCGDTYTTADQYGPHSYRKTTVRKPGADAAGIYQYTCTKCGYSYQEEYTLKKFTLGNVKYELSSNGKRAYVVGASSKKISSLTIPAKVKYNGKQYPVTRIKSHAFFKFSKLKKVTINASLGSVRSWAFYRCSSLKNITFTSAKVPSFEKNALGKISSKATIKVPKKSYTAYKKALKKSGIPSKVKVKKG